jgi:hypothetical protein
MTVNKQTSNKHCHFTQWLVDKASELQNISF